MNSGRTSPAWIRPRHARRQPRHSRAIITEDVTLKVHAGAPKRVAHNRYHPRLTPRRQAVSRNLPPQLGSRVTSVLRRGVAPAETPPDENSRTRQASARGMDRSRQYRGSSATSVRRATTLPDAKAAADDLPQCARRAEKLGDDTASTRACASMCRATSISRCLGQPRTELRLAHLAYADVAGRITLHPDARGVTHQRTNRHSGCGADGQWIMDRPDARLRVRHMPRCHEGKTPRRPPARGTWHPCS